MNTAEAEAESAGGGHVSGVAQRGFAFEIPAKFQTVVAFIKSAYVFGLRSTKRNRQYHREESEGEGEGEGEGDKVLSPVYDITQP